MYTCGCVQAHVCRLDSLRTNHGDMGLITPVGKAALRSLSNRWPDAQRVPSELLGHLEQTLSGERLGQNPDQQGWGCGPHPTHPFASASCIGRKESEPGSKGGIQTHDIIQTTHWTYLCQRLHICYLFNPLNSPRRSTIPIFSDKEIES